MSLDSALNTQREVLGNRLHGNTVSGKVITLLLDTQEIGYSLVGAEVLSNLSSVSRLIDNLLDDEGISYQELIMQVSEDSQIEELSLLIARLPEEVKVEFISKGKSVIKSMHKYNDNPNVKNRELEGEGLAWLYISILDQHTMDSTKEIFLLSLFKATYMFCDLKDLRKDSKSFSEGVIIINKLFVNTLRLIVSSKNKIKTLRKIVLAVVRSIKSSSNLSKNSYNKDA